MKYIAEFPMRYGDMARRVFTDREKAIKCASDHLRRCESPERERCEVWEYSPSYRSKKLIYENER